MDYVFNEPAEIKKYHDGDYKYITDIIKEKNISEWHNYRNYPVNRKKRTQIF